MPFQKFDGNLCSSLLVHGPNRSYKLLGSSSIIVNVDSAA